MTNPFDFSNDKPDIRELIPAGTPVLLEMTYTPGGANPKNTPQGQGEGALTLSKATATNPTPDVKYLKAEFTVLRGPYKGRKFWGNLTWEGGQVDEKGASKAGAITRKTVRAILDSSQGLSSKDESPDAAAKRVIRGFGDLQKKRFVALAKVEEAQNGFAAKNGLGAVLTIDMKNYPTEAQLDKPALPGAAPTPAIAAPVWGGEAQAAANSPAATQPSDTSAPAALQVSATVTTLVQPAAAPAPSPSGLPAWAA